MSRSTAASTAEGRLQRLHRAAPKSTTRPTTPRRGYSRLAVSGNRAVRGSAIPSCSVIAPCRGQKRLWETMFRWPCRWRRNVCDVGVERLAVWRPHAGWARCEGFPQRPGASRQRKQRPAERHVSTSRAIQRFIKGLTVSCCRSVRRATHAPHAEALDSTPSTNVRHGVNSLAPSPA